MRRAIQALLAVLLVSSVCLGQGTATVTVHLPPSDHRGEPDQAVMAQFDPLWDKCTAGVLGHLNNANTAANCKAAADSLSQLPADTRFTERRMANVYAATAFANIADFKAALPYASRAVDVVIASKQSGSGAESAYETRAQIRAFSGDLDAAEPDATAADEFAREMVKSGLSSSQLRKDLLFHAELLRRLGRSDVSEKLSAEAAKLTQ